MNLKTGKRMKNNSSKCFIAIVCIAMFILSTYAIAQTTFDSNLKTDMRINNPKSNTIKPLGDWWDLDWMYRKEITIDHNKVPSDLEDFPVLIDIVDSDLATKAQPDGDDIVFTDDNEMKLDHEIECYNNSNGHLVAWVNVTGLSATIDTSIYIYYGNSNAPSMQDPYDVWDSDYEAVWHLAEAAGGFQAWKDSTGNGYNGTDENMMQGEPGTDFDAPGKIDGAVKMDGVDDGIYTGLYPYDGPRTLEFWFNLESMITDSTVGCHDGAKHRFYAGTRYCKAFFGVGDNASADVPIDIQLGNWYYIAVTADGNIARYYFNSNEITSFSYTQTGASVLNFTIGYTNGNNFGFLNGTIDEVRVSYTDRSNSWITTCFNNQNDSDTFYGIGDEETFEVNQPPDKPSDPDPENNSRDVGINPDLSVYVTDLDDDTMDVSFYDASDDSLIGIDTNVPNGSRAEVTWNDLEYDTTYSWYAVANDSINETKSDIWTFTTEHDPDSPPMISIIKPEEKRFYFRDRRLFRLPRGFIIGFITIETEADDNDEVEQVEFYIDDNLKHICTEPDINGKYVWTWNDRAWIRFRHTIKVVAVDSDENTGEASMSVRIINFPLLHPLRP